jgi:hypothetical protein
LVKSIPFTSPLYASRTKVSKKSAPCKRSRTGPYSCTTSTTRRSRTRCRIAAQWRRLSACRASPQASKSVDVDLVRRLLNTLC